MPAGPAAGISNVGPGYRQDSVSHDPNGVVAAGGEEGVAVGAEHHGYDWTLLNQRGPSG